MPTPFSTYSHPTIENFHRRREGHPVTYAKNSVLTDAHSTASSQKQFSPRNQQRHKSKSEQWSATYFTNRFTHSHRGDTMVQSRFTANVPVNFEFQRTEAYHSNPTIRKSISHRDKLRDGTDTTRARANILRRQRG